MKFIYFLAASILIFVSCEKEDTTDQNNNNNNNTPSFSWKIDGDNYTDNSPVIDVNSSNVLTIDASDNSVDVRLIIYDFYSLSDGSDISLNTTPPKAHVTKNGVYYTDTQNGNLTFSEIGDSELSGSFNFQSRELVNFQSVTVTDGVFSNITY
ncbi:MAG: hypothetical protein HOA49_04170 [Flavobacteriales bacterium]|jgi:hypothetical protein|nr:hypothetical protein [Flavobacteriales bacterium]MBT5354732.1 hypothetical protein [Flavobacteriales bacterium]MBT5698559.1 hypothetical protein [Flavobacteriales bacterium]MBT6699624.1 hypothetical protein [Flavobacteriales bacterium]MBT6815582.1 hypothetical protein [Flavobacteriales bacterium]